MPVNLCRMSFRARVLAGMPRCPNVPKCPIKILTGISTVAGAAYTRDVRAQRATALRRVSIAGSTNHRPPATECCGLNEPPPSGE